MPNETSPMFAHVNEKRTACFSSSLYECTSHTITYHVLLNEVVRTAATVVGPTAPAITIGRNIVTPENRTVWLGGRAGATAFRLAFRWVRRDRFLLITCTVGMGTRIHNIHPIST